MVGARLALFAVLALVAWPGAIACFAAYVNWFSETGRTGGWAVLGLAWFLVLVALSATFAFAAAAIFMTVDRPRGHA